MKYRILRLLLFASALAWAVSIVGVILPWRFAIIGLNELGAENIPSDPMLHYWFRMTAGAFTGTGVFFFIVALFPRKYSNVIGIIAVLLFLEGLILLFYGLKLHLPATPFYADTSFCLLAGSGIWCLRKEAKQENSSSEE